MHAVGLAILVERTWVRKDIPGTWSSQSPQKRQIRFCVAGTDFLFFSSAVGAVDSSHSLTLLLIIEDRRPEEVENRIRPREEVRSRFMAGVDAMNRSDFAREGWSLGIFDGDSGRDGEDVRAFSEEGDGGAKDIWELQVDGAVRVMSSSCSSAVTMCSFSSESRAAGERSFASSEWNATIC